MKQLKQNSMAKNDSQETIVSEGMRIEGELQSHGDIRIDGAIVGKIQTTQDLIVGTSAEIAADVSAENATVSGMITGNVIVKNFLTITETGKITGNISCAHIAIREGGFFSGQCQMNREQISEIISESQV